MKLSVERSKVANVVVMGNNTFSILMTMLIEMMIRTFYLRREAVHAAHFYESIIHAM